MAELRRGGGVVDIVIRKVSWDIKRGWGVGGAKILQRGY